MSGARGGTAYELDTPRGVDWRESAACRPGQLKDHDLMWPLPNAHVQIEQARYVCVGCPRSALLECLAEGVDDRDWDSIRGGMTGAERRAAHQSGMPVEEWAPPGPRLKTCVRCHESFPRSDLSPRQQICGTCASSDLRRQSTNRRWRKQRVRAS